MSDILPGDEISADYWPPAVQAESFVANDNVTSTTPIAGTPAVNVTFVAPITGKVAVCVAGGIDGDSANDRGFVTYEMYLGTSAAGTLVQAARAPFGVSNYGGNNSDTMQHGNMTAQVGLTPGATYFARIVHFVEGVDGTVDIDMRRIIVFPIP